MLRVRKEQLDTLRDSRRISFESELALEIAAVHKQFPEGRIALEFVEAAVARAQRFGVTNFRDMARFANIAATLGSNFDEDPRYPWAAIILADPRMEPRDKISRLTHWTRRSLARAARRVNVSW